MNRSHSVSRRRFVQAGAAAGVATAASACATAHSPGPGADDRGAAPSAMPPGATAPSPPRPTAVRPRAHAPDRFDPWIELDRAAWAHNVREAARLAGGRPILAVVKNNAYGLGDRAVGPFLAEMPQVGGIAAVRIEEALAMREEGVAKPIVVMAEGSEDEIEEMARHNVLPSVWLDDASSRLRNVAGRLGRPVPVQLFIDTGMNREGMPHARARPWIEELVRSEHVDVNGVYTMFNHNLDFDREQNARFAELLGWARDRNLPLGAIHAAPTYELFHLPEAHYDMVRPGNVLFGNPPGDEAAREMATFRPVFSLKTRVVRVERLEPGDAAGFNLTFVAERATWVALLPVGRTDGYPSQANGACEVLVNGRLHPVAGGVNSAHTIIDVGPDKTVEVGDVATLIGPDHPAILPHTVAERTEVGFLRIVQSMNPRLPRLVV